MHISTNLIKITSLTGFPLSIYFGGKSEEILLHDHSIPIKQSHHGKYFGSLLAETWKKMGKLMFYFLTMNISQYIITTYKHSSGPSMAAVS
jgi:hypothetical protein